MRHRKSGRKFNRTSAHRQAMLRNMAVSLFEHEAIKTTLPKAKELRRVAEPLITLAKTDSVANRRLAFSRTRSKEMVGKLETTLAYVRGQGDTINAKFDGFSGRITRIETAVEQLVENELRGQKP